MELAARAEELRQRTFWTDQFPRLSVGKPVAGPLVPDDPARQVPAAWRERIQEEGYLVGRDDELARLAPVLVEGVETCHRLGIPPVFVFLFDETWECFRALHPVLRSVLGADYKVLPAFWTWRLDPQRGDAGWRPHRDQGRAALRADGRPASVTVWVPLTEATPDNGCMYVLPANRDPVYGTEREDHWAIEVPRIRALPVAPGEFLCWNQAVLHWGGEVSRFAAHPRISMALEFEAADWPPFYRLQMEPFAGVPFELRLQLVAKQVLQYRHMAPLPGWLRSLAERILGR
jgi:hypothetical protein